MQDAYTTAGRAREQQGLKEWLERRGVDVRDLSYSCEGFSAYNECDLHVGFRVHAHIYNLSQRIPSVLIEEDGRGWGAVEALGMKSHLDVKPRTRIAHYARTAQRRWIGRCSILPRPSDKDLVKKATRFVADELENGMPSSLDAVRTMCKTYNQMCSHIDLLSRVC